MNGDQDLTQSLLSSKQENVQSVYEFQHQETNSTRNSIDDAKTAKLLQRPITQPLTMANSNRHNSDENGQ